ncbi:MAG: DUF488 family protein [Coriobacteriales bacterium]
MDIKIKRVYEKPEASDGYRVLVDRLWPRGMRKADVDYDYWAKELTPSTEARKAFGHKAENFDSFKERYLGELNASDAAHACAQQLEEDATKAGDSTITLLYAAHDPKINHAVILKGWLEQQMKE